MNIIPATTIIETPIDGENAKAILKIIEAAGRTCYKSECKISETSASDFVRKIVHVNKHESVIEHASATVRFIIDRGISHELVRHRLAAFSQESSRYCSYFKESFGNQITIIDPAIGFALDVDNPVHVSWLKTWYEVMEKCEQGYMKLIADGAQAQFARDVLPNSLKTEVVMTCNMREWRHVFRMRCSKAAHPQIREVMIPLLRKFQDALPELFGDIVVES